MRAPAVGAPDVSLLVLAHDTPAEVESVLESIVLTTDGAYELVLLDNGSTPAGRDAHGALAERFGARFVELDANLTFSVANNVGARICSGDEIVFLNSDVETTPGWLANLRTALHADDAIAAVGPRTNASHAAQSGVWAEDFSREGVQDFGRFFNHSDPSRWFELEWLAGFALLVRRSAFEAVGGFDETIPWHGLEDKALGAALRAAGGRLVCAGDTFVFHHGHRTFDASGLNRAASRLGRPSATEAPAGETRLVRGEDGNVYELGDGIAGQVEVLPGLIANGRRIVPAAPGELDRAVLGPPVTAHRVRGGDEVWLLHGGRRRRVVGDEQRIRRLPWLATIERAELETLPVGPDAHVEDALPPVPEIVPRLPENPAAISPDRLLPPAEVLRILGEAMDGARGLSLVRLDRGSTLVLNQGLWPVEHAPRPDPAAAAALRRAVIGATIVGVVTDPDPAGAPLLERLLHHHDLYPARRCDAAIDLRLLGDGSSPLLPLLADKRIALVCPRRLADWSTQGTHRPRQRRLGYDIRTAMGLDDLREVRFVGERLAENRSSFDVVLSSAGIPGKLLCARLARELDVVALDLGPRLDGILHPAPPG